MSVPNLRLVYTKSQSQQENVDLADICYVSFWVQKISKFSFLCFNGLFFVPIKLNYWPEFWRKTLIYIQKYMYADMLTASAKLDFFHQIENQKK